MPALQYFGLHYHTLVHIYEIQLIVPSPSFPCFPLPLPALTTLPLLPLPSSPSPPLLPLPSPPYPGVTTWRCDKLQRLDLSHNHIRALPDCFQGLKKLKQLRVSYNILTELPLSLCWGSIGLVSQHYARTLEESSSIWNLSDVEFTCSNNFSASKTFRPPESLSITELFCN